MGGGGRIENKCCSLEALMDARRVCRKIGMPLYTTNFSEEFKENVVDNFLSEYARGNTPNPCVQCNRFVKLGLLIKKARELGFDYVASGHYVSNEKHKEEFKLYRGKDENKDQSYFLYTLNQERLQRLIFPLGKYTKDKVRQMAEKAGLPVAQKSESQEICFITGKSHNKFLAKYLKSRIFSKTALSLFYSWIFSKSGTDLRIISSNSFPVIVSFLISTSAISFNNSLF